MTSTFRTRLVVPIVAVACLAGLARGIDDAPLQVHVETRFVEIDRSEFLRFDIVGFGRNDRLDQSARGLFLQDAGMARGDLALSLGDLELDPLVNTTPAGLGAITQLQLGAKDLDKAIQAAEKNKRVKLIEAPLITFINRQRAALVSLQQAPKMFPKGKGGMNRAVAQHRDQIFDARFRLDALNDSRVYEGIPFLGAFGKQGGKKFADRQGFDVAGDLKLQSKKQYGSKSRFLAMRGKGNEPGNGQLLTRAVFPTDATVSLDVGIFLKVTPKVVGGADGRIVLRLDAVTADGTLTGDYVRVGIDHLPDGQRSGFVEVQGGSPMPIVLPSIETARAVTPVLQLDGQTVVISGLLDAPDANERTPTLLADLPFVGSYFRAAVRGEGIGRKNTAGASNLLILVTPQIVQPDEE